MTAGARCIDGDLLDAMVIPSEREKYDRNSRAYVRLDSSLRLYWHALFDICPRLLDLSGPDGLTIFKPFMVWAWERKLSLNWTYYLWVCEWLQQSEFRDRVSRELTLSLMGAAVANWAIRDRTDDSGIVVGSAAIPEIVVAWKCHTVDGARSVETLELEERLPSPTDSLFGCFTLPEFEVDRFPGWRPIPR